MSEETEANNQEAPANSREASERVDARVSEGPRISTIWFVPIIAVLIGLWMVYTHYTSQGPLIEITFESAEGIEPGRTKVRRRNVEIGEVLRVRLSDDANQVVLDVRIQQENADLLREDTSFWVVRPRVGPGGVSGLSTLLSGSYIEMSPGTADESAREFEGLEAPPLTPIGTPGLFVTLDSSGNKALQAGDPILFNGLQVGRIEYVHFNSEERRTYYNAFVEAPYDRLVTTNTQFWFSSGINMEISADGARFEVPPLTTLIGGGVAFDVPAGQPLGERIKGRAFFTIHPRESSIYERYFEQSLQYVILFEDSIRGLRPGAPVEFRGVRVGEVLRTVIDFVEVGNLLDESSMIPVLIELVPGRFGFDDDERSAIEAEAEIDELISQGLHGGIGMGNLLTGQKFIELQYFESEPHPDETFAGVTVIPSVGGQVGRLMDSVADTVANLNELPLEEMTDSAVDALDQMTTTLAELETVLTDEAMQKLIQSIDETLEQFQLLAEDFSEGSQMHEDMQRAIRSLEQTLFELEPALRNLRQRPNSLIFGGPGDEDPEPQGARQ